LKAIRCPSRSVSAKVPSTSKINACNPLIPMTPLFHARISDVITPASAMGIGQLQSKTRLL
jgi:hypothetical protein